MAQDNTLWPVTKKANPKFIGLATASMIAKSRGKLILCSEARLAEPVVEKAKKVVAEQEIRDANPGKPSEAVILPESGKPEDVKPQDIRRRPTAS